MDTFRWSEREVAREWSSINRARNARKTRGTGGALHHRPLSAGFTTVRLPPSDLEKLIRCVVTLPPQRPPNLARRWDSRAMSPCSRYRAVHSSTSSLVKAVICPLRVADDDSCESSLARAPAPPRLRRRPAPPAAARGRRDPAGRSEFTTV
jgi:hypothetical protein